MKYFLAILFLASCFIAPSCKKEQFLRSEKNVEKDLQGRWKRSIISSQDTVNNVVWQFQNGNLFVYHNNIIKDSATYSVRTTLTKVYLTTDGVNEACSNGEWTVVTLDDDILSIANDECGGLTQREFEKL